MRKLSILATLFAGTLALGCGSTRSSGPAQPNNVSGQAATTGTGVDSVGNPAPGTATGTPPGTAADPAEQPGIESGEGIDSTAPNPSADDGQGTTSPSSTDAAGDINGNPDQGTTPTPPPSDDSTTTTPDNTTSSPTK